MVIQKTEARKRKLSLVGNRFQNRYLPFTKLGTYFENGVDSITALQEANLDYQYQIDEPTARYKFPDNEQYSISIKGDYRAVVRPPVAGKYEEPEWIANVTDRYTLVQNNEVAEFIQPLSEQYPVKVAGELGRGRTIFYVLAGSELEISERDEQINTYILVKDSKDGSSGLSFGLFAVRVKCMNMQMFSKDILYSYRLRHTDSIRENVKIMSTAFSQLSTTNQWMLDKSETFMAEPLSVYALNGIINSAYPLPERHFMSTSIDYKSLVEHPQWAEKMKAIDNRQDVAIDRIIQMREKALSLHKNYNEENPKTANTMWSALQAVTELSTWREGSKADASILFGARANEVYRAYDYAENLCGNEMTNLQN
jgi:hypothetical protein